MLATKRTRRIPSERNRRIWEQVVLNQREQQEVAREFCITQQRVSQIIDHFQAWLAEQLPAGSERFSGEEQLRLGLSTAYLRQQHLYGQAMRDSDASWQDKHAEKVRYGADDKVLWRETVRANQCGKVGYLSAAMRAAQNVLKIVQMSGGHLSRAMEISFWLPGDVSDRSGRFQTDMAPPVAVSQVLCDAADLTAGSACGAAPQDAHEPECPPPAALAEAPNPCAADSPVLEPASAKVLCGDPSSGIQSPPAELIAAALSADDPLVAIEKLPPAPPLPLLDDLLTKSCAPSIDGMIRTFARRREDRELSPAEARKKFNHERQRAFSRRQALRAS